MNELNTVRAWKDPEFRAGLSADDRARLMNPAGVVELSNDELLEVGGGTTWVCAATGPIAISLSFCTITTSACGTCQFGTRACC